ncbi:MAG: hypothetical protein Q9159_004869 [Coniocarpon cinnabarinum]
MPVVNAANLIKLQNNPNAIRNICILAHVDHGKTSLTDSLIATNGIISPKMAGKIRYLDSRPDEQTRGITMESSAISLIFSILRKRSPELALEPQDHLINLIDSPGHVDFSSEVSTASRLCDGAVILVDAVEGVCSQTISVLRQTWVERLKPVLVINKMDRLITELRMSPQEAYSHLSKLLEQVNAVMGSFFQGERMEDDLKWRERLEARVSQVTRPQENATRGVDPGLDHSSSVADVDGLNDPSRWEEKDDEGIYFEPERGNVIFSSATDGWAFTAKQFASFYEKKLGINRKVLERVLWGDYYLDPKTKRILAPKHVKGRSLKPLFVQLVLENIWAVYEAATGGDKGKGDTKMVEKICSSLSLNLPGHVLRSRDPKAILTPLFSAWIPLSTAVLVSVIEHLPSPIVAQKSRTSDLVEASPGAENVDPRIKNSMENLVSSDSEAKVPSVAFVSKMVAVPKKDLPENKTRAGKTLTAEQARELGRKKRAEIARAQAAANGEHPDVAELKEALSDTGIEQGADNRSADSRGEESGRDEEQLIGFARLFSGKLTVGDELYVLTPKFTPRNPHASPEPQKVTITALYLLMGRDLESLTTVPPGVVFGIGGLEGHIMKSGTLCSQVDGGINLAGVSMGGEPIVRVALEPQNPMDLDKMIMGLRLLEQSDPCARYEVLENGEHVILTAGELHLERCLKDLKERFAQCEIQAGASIVPYRESIVSATEMNPPKTQDLPRGTVVMSEEGRLLNLRVRVIPLPQGATEYLMSNETLIQDLYEAQSVEDIAALADGDAGTQTATSLRGQTHHHPKAQRSLQALQEGLHDVFGTVKTNRDLWKVAASNTVAFGPRRVGPNILVDNTSGRICHALSIQALLANGQSEQPEDDDREQRYRLDLSSKISYAFQLATAQGPLCNEPMQGVAVFLEEFSTPEAGGTGTSADVSGRLTGEVLRAVRDSIRQGLLDWSPRILLAMYKCEIQASTEVLGRVYGVVTRRRGRIVAESMNEGTPFFTVTATLPVAESFGFSEEIRKRTSGAASPQLIFSGYEMLDEDPFWVPFTEEELEDLGEIADRENIAKKYVDGVRRRKGLFVQGSKVVTSAEKQKTLKK